MLLNGLTASALRGEEADDFPLPKHTLTMSNLKICVPWPRLMAAAYWHNAVDDYCINSPPIIREGATACPDFSLGAVYERAEAAVNK